MQCPSKYMLQICQNSIRGRFVRQWEYKNFVLPQNHISED